MRTLSVLGAVVVIALAFGCTPSNLGSNVKGGDLTQATEVWVSPEGERPGNGVADWHVASSRAFTAELASTLSTAQRIEDVVGYRPGGDGQIILVMESAPRYGITFWLEERHLWDEETMTWYAMPGPLAGLLDDLREQPTQERQRALINRLSFLNK